MRSADRSQNFATVGDQMKGPRVLLLSRGHLHIAVVEGLVARAFARLARLQAVLVGLVAVSMPLVLGHGCSLGHGDETGGTGPEDAENFSTVHDDAPLEAIESWTICSHVGLISGSLKRSLIVMTGPNSCWGHFRSCTLLYAKPHLGATSRPELNLFAGICKNPS